MPLSHERHGAFPNKNGTTHFSLWAPDAISVAVQLGSGEIHNMPNDVEGWFRTTVECPAGTNYSFLINGSLTVPDPAARAQADDVHGFSAVVDQSYPWKCVTWQGRPWHEAIIYEIHVGLSGGFAKVEASLPSLVDLGVTAIQLMPVNEFPGERNWGYDGVLLFAPEASYGTPAQLKSLIDSAHGLGLMVFLDVVYNHFGPDGNYIGEYAKDFFRSDLTTPWGSAIDFRQREVREFFIENALMWVVDYRVDGLRFDAVHNISDKDFLVELARQVRAALLPSRQLHLILENEDNSASLLEKGFIAQWNDDGHNILHHLLTGEDESYYADFCDAPTAKLARFLSEGFIYQGEFSQQGKGRGEPSGHLPPTSFVLFLQNHDQIGNRALGERLTLLANPDALKAAVVLLLLSPMVPLLFMGEEWGSKQPFLFFTDHKDDLAKAVCEGRRKEFAAFSAFNDKKMREKIPDPNAVTSFTQSQLDDAVHQSPEHFAYWNFYRELLQLRLAEIIPRLPGTLSAGVTILAERALCASWTMGDGGMLKIYLNLSEGSVKTTPTWSEDRLLYSCGVAEKDYQENSLPALSALVTLEKAVDRKVAETHEKSLAETAENIFVLVE
ncbi:MAG TPA: malto-oligosyltrehalose trehalohydrolase [Cellvibrio sp.]|nr:malto-oligosyltrehalose trehalohydrolase [Cellvibrio sp.]